MANAFIVTTPLTCLFANLVARRFPDEENIAFCNPRQPHYWRMYERIDEHMGSRLHKRPFDGIESGDGSERYRRLFLANRFSKADRAAFMILQKRVETVALHDGEMSLFTGHFWSDWTRNDTNRALRFSNWCRRLCGKLPRQVYLSDVDLLFSVFDDIEGLPSTIQRVSILDDFRALLAEPDQQAPRMCLLLSQVVVKEQMLNAEEYFDYLKDLARCLRRDYDVVYFKPHPREQYHPIARRLSCEADVALLPEAYQELPVELFLARNPTIDVYGFWSTAMFYGAHAFGLRCYSLLPHLLDRFPRRPRLERSFERVHRHSLHYGVVPFVPNTEGH